MTSAAPGSPAVDPRMWMRRVAVTREQGRKRLRVVIGVLAVCAIASGGFAAIHSSLFGARHMNVMGAVHTPVAEVLALIRADESDAARGHKRSGSRRAHRSPSVGEERIPH